MNVLVVGAGAVGLVYGLHLDRGGARVSLLARPRQREALAAGAVVLRHRRGGVERLLWRPAAIHVSPEEAVAERHDQVWLCIGSHALRRPEVETLLEGVGPATVVGFAVGPRHRAWLAERVPAGRLVRAAIPFLAYQTPLPGQHLEPGAVAYWVPPAGATPLSGPRAHVAEVVATLRRGGLPARRHRDASALAEGVSAVMMPVVAALEIAGWSIDALVRGRWLAVACAGAREAARAVAADTGRRPVGRLAARPVVVRVLLQALRRRAPFDAEAYLRYHFTKVGAQTRELLDDYLAMCRTHALPDEALRQLRGALPKG